MSDVSKTKIEEQEDEIVIPVRRSKRVPQYYYADKKVFDGKTLPIPYVVTQYLHEVEMKLFAIILDQTREHGSCAIRMKTFAKLLGKTIPTVSYSLSRMKRMGIINVNRIGYKSVKSINFRAIQYLHDNVQGMKPGAIPGLRKLMKDRYVTDITPAILEKWHYKFDYKDEVEEEVYE